MHYFEQIEAMHQQVREFVEQQEPNYKVTEIDAYFTTGYMPTFASRGEVLPHQDFVLVEIKARFRVSASYINKRLSCEVYVTSDDRLYLADQVLSM